MSAGTEPHHSEASAPAIGSASTDGVETFISPFFQTKVVADQHYRRGLELEAGGQWERALQSFRNACAMHPHRRLYLLARGRLAQAHSLDREAQGCYEIARRLDPSDPVVLFNQAELWARTGDRVGAIANLQLILSDQRSDLGQRAGWVHRFLADLHLRDGHCDRAERHYRTAYEILPGDQYIRASLAAVGRFGDLFRFHERMELFTLDGTLAPKPAVYAHAGAMLLGLPDDDGVNVPTYPALGFETLSEIGAVLARPLALFRARTEPFRSIVALEPAAEPIVAAFSAILGVRNATNDTTAVRGAATLGIAISANDPDQITQNRLSCPHMWVYSIGLTRPAYVYAQIIDGASSSSFIEVPWAASRLVHNVVAGDLSQSLTNAITAAIESPTPQTVVARHLNWHRHHAGLWAGDPALTYRQANVC